MISISPGLCADLKVSGVPHREQNVRAACSDDGNELGVPDVKRKVVSGTVNQATNGAPLVRRHAVQWQFVSNDANPAVS